MGNRAEQAVDFAYLESYAAGDEAVVAEVLELFREQAKAWEAKLSPEADWAEVVHTIKGAARGVGAVALGEVCARAEQAGPGSLPEVRAALTEALAAIEAYVGQS